MTAAMLKTMRNPVDARIRVYDNEGKTIDNYTVIYMDIHDTEHGRRVYQGIRMDGSPLRPWGKVRNFHTHTIGRSLGLRIPFRYLPEQCQRLVLSDLAEIDGQE